MKAATEFAETLLAAARVDAMARSPLVAGIVSGTLSRETVRRYALVLASTAIGFPRSLAAVLSICDEDEVRRSLLGNLLEEEGVVAYVPGEGVRVEEARRHGVMARKFVRAAGASDADVPTAPLARWFSDAIARRDWLGAFAFFAVGFEANVPATFRQLVEPLIEHYGFTRDELEFLVEHFTADERHGVEAAHLIARVATTDDARQRALAGARRGGAAWWSFHRAAAAERVPA